MVVFTLAGAAKAAQELSTHVYPSEDELEEAYYRGELDIFQFLTLQEIIRNGIDSTHLYLLDEIPNLSYFLKLRPTIETELETEQEKGFLGRKSIPGPISGKFSHSFSHKIEEDGDSRYRGYGYLKVGDEFRSAFRLHKEYSGRQRFAFRNIVFRPKKSVVNQITFGNYTTRLGLGTIVGYRGKLVSYSGDINEESLLYPDYGGYNGLRMKLGKSRFESEFLFSQNRDSEHTVKTIGGEIGHKGKIFSPMVIVSLTNLKNRISYESINDLKYGLGLETKYNDGYNRFEMSAQSGEYSSFGAIVTEGRHLFENADINYAVWHYDDKYLDLTGGSKAASIRETIYLDDVDFSYSDKRTGQSGGIIKTTVEPAERVKLINSVLYANKDKENYNFEFLSAIVKSLSENWQTRLDHVSRIRNRIRNVTESNDELRRTRVELRYINPEFYVRAYLAYHSETDKDDYSAVFLNFRYKSRETGETSVWINVGEIDHNRKLVNYWYGYIENKMRLLEGVNTMVKLAHSYRRELADEHTSTVSIGVEILI